MEVSNTFIEIKIESYCKGKNSSSNYGIHCLKLEIGRLALYFSYGTVVAFELANRLTISKTTGKHLNAINTDKNLRIEKLEFNEKLQKLLNDLGLKPKIIIKGAYKNV